MKSRTKWTATQKPRPEPEVDLVWKDLAEFFSSDIIISLQSFPMPKSKSVSAQEYKSIREAIRIKMMREGFDAGTVNSFTRMLDRIGHRDIIDFLFLMEKVAPLLPFTEDERLEARQIIKKADTNRTCPTCKRKMSVSTKFYHCFGCNKDIAR